MAKRFTYAFLALLLLGIEVIIATHFNNSFFIRAYFGDFLVVILLYYLLQALHDFPPKRLALSIFIFACFVETAQYFQLADHLHLTGIARILVGTSFSWIDILMYAAGCLSSYYLDNYWHYYRNPIFISVKSIW